MNLRTKTIIGIGIIETILLVILIISSIGFLSRSNDEQIQNRAETAVKLFAVTTKDAVLSTDLDSLQSFVGELLTNSDIAYVRILGDGINLAQGGDIDALNRPFVADKSLQTITDGIFDTTASIQESGYVFGVIELGISVSSTTQLITKAWKWAAGIALVEILLVALFSYILGTYLTRQLQHLTTASQTIGLEGPGLQIDVKGNDEIAQLSRSFNHMSKSLSDTYERINSSALEFRDIAEQLEESDARKSNMLSTALDAIITIDSNGLIEEFNETAQTIFGYSRNEALGKSLEDLIIPDEHRAAHKNGMEHWRKTGEAPILGERFEITAIRKNGEVFPIELAITKIEVKDATFFTGFIRDITKQKNADLELRMAASAFDAQEGIFITDSDAKIIRVNNAFGNITGYKPVEAIGATPAEIFNSGRHDKAFYRKMWHDLLHTGRWEGEIYNRRKNGEIYPQWLGISAIRDNENQIENFVAHFIDISQRKRFEEDLVSARHKAESANIAKSQFLAAMSHEIRTPLNGVIGMTDLLLKSETQSRKIQMLRTANQSAQILLDIIKNILDFSKIESGEMSLELIPVSINRVIEEACEILAPVAQQKNVKLIIFIDPEISHWVLSDSVRLHQILFNLCSNAIKFTHTDAIKEGRVILRAESVENSSDPSIQNVRILIEDNGVGISEKALGSIFEPFSQAELSTTRQYGGSGLGLAITSRIVEAMQGSIEVESLLGTGSRFSVELPFELLADEEKQDRQLNGTRVLVAESFSPFDKYLPDYLKQQDADVTLVSNLEIAQREIIQAIQNSKPYDVIIVGAAWATKQQEEWVMSLKKQLHSELAQFILLADTLSHSSQTQTGIRYLNAFPLLPTDLIQQVVSAANHLPVIENLENVNFEDEESAVPGVAFFDASILLAEDNEVNKEVIRLQLQEIGLQVDIASDGVEAIEMYRQKHYDLVLTDCHMPNMDGFQLTREIRQMEGPKGDIPIIAITADSLAAEESDWADVGMNEYLTKPLKVDELEAALSRFIKLDGTDEPDGSGQAIVEGVGKGNVDEAVYDKHALKKVVGNAPLSVRKNLLKKFLLSNTKSVTQIVEAWSQKDVETVQREAHKLKSSAKVVGAFKLSKSCSTLEVGCKQNNLTVINQAVETIPQEFEEVSVLIEISIASS